MTMASRKTSKTGRETKDKIIDAALETVRLEGLVGTSARAIARAGDFNQALVFYHFGSVEELLFAALERAHARRMDKFGPMIGAVEDLDELVRVGIQMRSSGDDPDMMALSGIVASWPVGSELGPRIIETLAPWDDLVSAALGRAFAGSPVAGILPYPQLARAVSSLFLGLELFGRLDPESASATETYEALANLAALSKVVLQGMADPGIEP